MNDREFRRRLQLDSDKYDAMLRHLDEGARGDGAEKRTRPRLEYPVADIGLSIDHQHGSSANFLVFGRNVSGAGISILHGGYVHAGSACRLILDTVSGRQMTVDGEVRYCRLVAGSCHEIGVRFHEEIDPKILRGAGENSLEPTVVTTGAEQRRELKGRVLLTDDFLPDLVLLRFQLGLHGGDILLAKTPGAAIDTLKREHVDVVVSGLSIGSDEGIRTLDLMRELGFAGGIVVLTAETNPDAIRRARAAGATEIMPKPYNLDLLLALLESLLGMAEVPRALFSTAADQPGMPPLITRYVHRVRDLGEQVKDAYNEGDWTRLDAICVQLKGSGCGYGFQNVTSAAIAAMRDLGHDRGSAESRIALARLIECCRALEVSETVGDAV